MNNCFCRIRIKVNNNTFIHDILSAILSLVRVNLFPNKQEQLFVIYSQTLCNTLQHCWKVVMKSGYATFLLRKLENQSQYFSSSTRFSLYAILIIPLTIMNALNDNYSKITLFYVKSTDITRNYWVGIICKQAQLHISDCRTNYASTHQIFLHFFHFLCCCHMPLYST